MKGRGMHFTTTLLHGRAVETYPDHAVLPPIAQVTAFGYDSAEQQERVFAHRAPGYAYTRIGNPTVSAFERRIRELEGGSAAVACASGMAAVSLALLNILSAGDEIVAGTGLYGGTFDLFRDLERFGITVRLAPRMDEESVEPLITPRTKAVYGELIGNPRLDIMDIPRLSKLAHDHGIPLIVDATTATPYLVRPLSLGADIVVHSSSKYINGGGNSISGVIVDGGAFPWDFERFEALRPFARYGPLAYQVRLRTDLWENIGACLSPFNAYMNVVGIETLGLRMQRITENADRLAHALAALPGIRVNYPTLPDHPYHGLCQMELGGRGGGILTFRTGSRQRAFDAMKRLKYAVIASNIGDVRTLVLHPASTLYRNRTEEERSLSGVEDDTVRVSVGIEESEDLIADFTQALTS